MMSRTSAYALGGKKLPRDLANMTMTGKSLIPTYILTYRNNPSYISIVILFFLSVGSNTDQILMK